MIQRIIGNRHRCTKMNFVQFSLLITGRIELNRLLSYHRKTMLGQKMTDQQRSRMLETIVPLIYGYSLTNEGSAGRLEGRSGRPRAGAEPIFANWGGPKLKNKKMRRKNLIF